MGISVNLCFYYEKSVRYLWDYLTILWKALTIKGDADTQSMNVMIIFPHRSYKYEGFMFMTLPLTFQLCVDKLP